MVLLQADMFDLTYTPNFANDISAFQPLVQALVDEASAFGGPVYLVNGDSHVYKQRPAPRGRVAVAGHLRGHRVCRQPRADHRRRLNNNKDWLRVTVNRPGADRVLTWERIPYTS